jgi:ribosomal protein L35
MPKMKSNRAARKRFKLSGTAGDPPLVEPAPRHDRGQPQFEAEEWAPISSVAQADQARVRKMLGS